MASDTSQGALARGVRLGWQAASIAACVWLWHLASTHKVDLGVLTFQNVPPPSDVLQSALALFQSPKLWQHLGSSLGRVLSGFALAVVAGVGLGVLIGRSVWAQRLIQAPLEVMRPIPAVAWIPLAVLMFPSSEGSMIFITFVGALFPILLNTVHGVEGVDTRLIASARSLGSGPFALLTGVVLPGAAPSIITGLSIGMGTCWFCLITAEMISGQYGIGYYTWESYTIQDYGNIVVGMLLIGVLGMASSAVIRHGGAFLTPWYRPKGAR